VGVEGDLAYRLRTSNRECGRGWNALSDNRWGLSHAKVWFPLAASCQVRPLAAGSFRKVCTQVRSSPWRPGIAAHEVTHLLLLQ